MTNYETLKASALELLEQDETFVDCVNELDSWNGFADGYRLYDMCELDDLYHGYEPSEILGLVTSGFNINDDYFCHTIWGLESANDCAEFYRDHTDAEEVFNHLVEYYGSINIAWIDDELDEIIEKIVDEDYDNEDDEE